MKADATNAGDGAPPRTRRKKDQSLPYRVDYGKLPEMGTPRPRHWKWEIRRSRIEQEPDALAECDPEPGNDGKKNEEWEEPYRHADGPPCERLK